MGCPSLAESPGESSVPAASCAPSATRRDGRHKGELRSIRRENWAKRGWDRGVPSVAQPPRGRLEPKPSPSSPRGPAQPSKTHSPLSEDLFARYWAAATREVAPGLQEQDNKLAGHVFFSAQTRTWTSQLQQAPQGGWESVGDFGLHQSPSPGAARREQEPRSRALPLQPPLGAQDLAL